MRVNPQQKVIAGWLIVAVMAAIATDAPEQWTLDTTKVMQGEWWRMVSGHFAHLNWQHYSFDLAALGLSLYLCCQIGSCFHEIISSALLSACAVSASVLVVRPVDIYGGISGITAGLLSYAAAGLIFRNAWGTGAALATGMICKIFLEWHGISASNITPVWQAHCAGTAGGLIAFVLYRKGMREHNKE
jgi:rhomboid family GlyGly-CTERM serine protease